MNHDFYKELRETYNRGASKVFALTGNINDLFFNGTKYTNLVSFLLEKIDTANSIQIIYELNGPLRTSPESKKKLCDIWCEWQNTTDRNEFENKWSASTGKPHYGLEFLRQLSLGCRVTKKAKLAVVIEAADAVLPENRDVASLSPVDRRSIFICRDWFSDPEMLQGEGIVILLSETVGLINQQITRIPQVYSIEIPLPDTEQRLHYLQQFTLKSDLSVLSKVTACLSLTAIRQLAMGREEINIQQVYEQIEKYIIKELGDGVVEFKKPTHTLEDVVANRSLKSLIINELIPRFRSSGADCLSGVAIAGPIGSGKTFIWEAVAGFLDYPVLTIKNIRSKYFGETDVLANRFKRLVESMDKVIVFIDEADTQFGSLSSDEHSTERRLTGFLQSMMSDNKLKGKVTWLLMTARIHLLSPDIRRPGRAGDMIIPVLDSSSDEDKLEFCQWLLKPLFSSDEEVQTFAKKLISRIPNNYSAASFASLKSALIAKKASSWESIEEALYEIMPSDNLKEREYQRLQALLNCTRLSILKTEPEIEQAISGKNNVHAREAAEKIREKWRLAARELEKQGYGR